MITHHAADSTVGEKHITSSVTNEIPTEAVLSSLERSESAPSLETLEEEMLPTRCAKYRSLILVGMTIWVGQILVAISLKKCGYIQKDFNDIMAERVPKLQQQIEQSFSWSAFNETKYWSLLNESMRMGHITQERQRPAFQLSEEGATGQYPVVMIPGFVTSGLEMWAGKECGRKYFRQRLWGGVNSARLLLMERDCVLQHLALDPLTGGDPEGIRLRAAQGFDAADYFMANYWVWGKILENLADVGYDGSKMSMESYDWRLAFPLLEERDGYLTKLKHKIEAFHLTTGKKIVLTSHSLGGILVHFFFAWVTESKSEGGGGGGKDWVDKHIHAYVNIAGAHLGVPKAASALFSGEFRETIFLGTAGNVVEQFLGRKLRKELWNTWGSLWSMLPKGGDALWGIGADLNNEEVINLKSAPGANDSSHDTTKLSWLEHKNHDVTPLLIMTDDKNDQSFETREALTCPTTSEQTFIDSKLHEDSARTIRAFESFASRNAHSVSQTVDFLVKWGAGLGSALSSPNLHSFNHKAKSSPKTWHDVSRTPLPHAPNMKIYCLYGVGLDTERAYYYKNNPEKESRHGADNDTFDPSRQVDLPYILDSSVVDPNRQVVNGVKYVDGDASVPLLSLGYMCNDAWRRQDSGLNPSNIEVITREYSHRQEFSVDDPIRMGPYSADHVDILGNVDMMEDLMKIVTDHNLSDVKNRVVSNIEEIAKRINEHPQGGLYKTQHGWQEALGNWRRRLFPRD